MQANELCGGEPCSSAAPHTIEQSGAGGSRAAQRRQRKRAKQEGAKQESGPSQPCAALAPLSAPLPAPPPQAPTATAIAVAPRPPREEEVAAATSGTYREWQMAMPAEGDELFDALQIALAQAATIQGRKYRYGALLLAGEDLIPIKSGSNKKPFLRDNIHAEMSVLKGCDRPRGKDMLIVRLAPAKRARRDEDADDGSDFDIDEAVTRSCAPPDTGGKILNARPCARCEAKMVERGVRRCLFTLNARTVGVVRAPSCRSALASPIGRCSTRNPARI